MGKQESTYESCLGLTGLLTDNGISFIYNYLQFQDLQMPITYAPVM